MSEFIQSKRFRAAWMVSLIAGVLFPFVDAAMNSDSELGYLAHVNESYFQKSLTFAAVFLAIQCVWALILHRKDSNKTEGNSK